MATTCRSAERGLAMGTAWARVLTIFVLFVGGNLAVHDASGADDKPATSKSKAHAQKPSQAAQPDDDDDPADDTLQIDEDLTALVVPAELLTKAKSLDKLKFAQDLRGLLLEGMTADADSLAAAKRHFEAAHSALADDPRAPYAYGLSLLSHNKTKEALEQFRAASSISPAPFLPALQAIAWAHISSHDFAKGLPAVRDLARKIAETKGPWPTDHDRRHAAEWLGRMMGYLSGPGKNPDQTGEIDKLAGDIDKLLTQERKEAYQRGVQSIAARHEKMQALAARPVAEVLAEAEKKRRELLAAAQAADADLKRLENDIREITRPHDKQVADWSHELRTAATQHRRSAQDLAEAGEQVAYYSTPQAHTQVRTTGRGRYRRPVMSLRAETAQEKKARETQLASARQRAQQAQSTFDQTRQQMTDIKSQRAQADAEYHKATAEKRPRISEARKKSRELAAHAHELEHNSLTAEKIKSRVTAVETYVPLNFEIEKSRLLATLKSPR
ncbi:MAG TPA: hypothetical protein VGH74_16215 [Planctomycetaceae bacterium]